MSRNRLFVVRNEGAVVTLYGTENSSIPIKVFSEHPSSELYEDNIAAELERQQYYANRINSLLDDLHNNRKPTKLQAKHEGKLEEFWNWTGAKVTNPDSSFFLSLETWATKKFNEAYDQEYKKS